MLVFPVISVISDSLKLWAVVCHARLSMGFSLQEYWIGLPCPSPGIFLMQGSNLGLLHYRQILYHLSHKGSPNNNSKSFKSSLVSNSYMHDRSFHSKTLKLLVSSRKSLYPRSDPDLLLLFLPSFFF